MWEELLAAATLERAGFLLDNKDEGNYEKLLNQYFMQNIEDEFLLELQIISSDLEQTFYRLKKDCARNFKKYNRCRFAYIVCKKLEKIYNNISLKEFTDCACRLWEMLPICQLEPPLSDLRYLHQVPVKRDIVCLAMTCREMFRYYFDGLDREAADAKEMSLQNYLSIHDGRINPDFERAEILLGFELNQSIRNFYSRVFARKIIGNLIIPKAGFIIPTGKKRFDQWFSSNGIEGKTEIHLFPCPGLKNSSRFIRDHFYQWTGERGFGERVWIGEIYTRIGAISIVINNLTSVVEWVDCGYGHYTQYEKNPNGVLAEHIEPFIEKLKNEIIVLKGNL